MSKIKAQIENQFFTKLSVELKLKINELVDNKKIPVYISRKEASYEDVRSMLLQENKIDPNVYENDKLFEEKIAIPKKKDLEVIYGFERTYMLRVTDEDGNNSLSLADQYINAEKERYQKIKLDAIRKLNNRANNAFLEKHFGKDREIIYSRKYTPALILELSKIEIEQIAADPDVEKLDCIDEVKCIGK